MKKTIIILASVVSAVVVLGVIGLLVVGPAFAQTSLSRAVAPMMGWNRGSGCGGGCGGGVISGTNPMHEAIANTLGATTEQLYAERSEGKTLTQIAQERGVSEQQLTDAILAARKQLIDQAVEDGRITQAQADWMQTAMKTMIPLMLDAPFEPGQMRGFGGRGYGRGGGGMVGHSGPCGGFPSE